MSEYDNRRYAFNGEVRRRKLNWKNIGKLVGTIAATAVIATNGQSIIRAISDVVAPPTRPKIETKKTQEVYKRSVKYLKELNPQLLDVMANSLYSHGWPRTSDKPEDTLEFFFSQIERVNKEGTDEHKKSCRFFYVGMMSAGFKHVLSGTLQKNNAYKNITDDKVSFFYQPNVGVRINYNDDNRGQVVLADNFRNMPLPNAMSDAIRYIENSEKSLNSTRDYEEATKLFTLIFCDDISVGKTGNGFEMAFDNYYQSINAGGLSRRSECIETYLMSQYNMRHPYNPSLYIYGMPER